MKDLQGKNNNPDNYKSANTIRAFYLTKQLKNQPHFNHGNYDKSDHE